MSAAAGARVSNQQPRRGGFQRVWRTLRQIFHEVVGAIFAILAFSWTNAAIRAWRRDAAYWLIAVAAGVAASFAVFAFTSYRRSRAI
jgi:uncharacterized membrane protein